MTGPNPFGSLQEFTSGSGARGKFYRLAALEAAGLGQISRLPHSIRVVLESVLRNCDGNKVTEDHARQVRGREASHRPTQRSRTPAPPRIETTT